MKIPNFQPFFSKQVVRFKIFYMMKASSKSIARFNKIDEMASVASSCRTSSVRNITQHMEEEQKMHFQQEEMKNIRQKIFIKKVIKQLQSLIALNKAPQEISQEWQGKEENENIKQNLHQLPLEEEIMRYYPWMRLCKIIQGFSMILFVWFLSVAVVFQEQIFDQKFFGIVLIEMLNLISQIVIINYDQRLATLNYKFKKKKLIHPMVILCSCALMMIKNAIEIRPLEIVIDVLMFGVCLYLAKQIPKYFRVVKTYAEEKKLIKELRIIELFCVLLVVAHVFGLMIYSSIYLRDQGEMTWLMSDGKALHMKPWLTQYIYSVYFAITTIVTVGYGDLTPQNEAEVVVIMILEICGTSFFGYMINVIGITVDNINKKNEEYDNYQQTISKLKDHYQLSEELCFEMKRDIENKYNEEHKAVSLKKNQEMDFLEYVDSTVKKNFILETNIKIIKKSIFFLTFFTVSFQNYVALKLIRVIYKKDENIETYDPVTRQRNIIIVNHGKVNLFIQKRQNNIIKNKLVRTIQPIEGKPALNVIGYSSLILNMDIDVFSKASEMTSGYVLKMSDVVECIDKSMIDYESFHEMREKMLLYSMKEAIEAPSLKDSCYHYTPNIFILSSRCNLKARQKRKKVNRKKKRGFLLVDRVKTQLEKEGYTVNQDEESYLDDSDVKDKVVNIDDFDSLLSVDLEGQNEEPVCLRFLETQVKADEKYQGKLNVDQVKIFEYFMRNHNINYLAAQYERACSAQSYNKRIQTCHLIKHLSTDNKEIRSRANTKQRSRHSFKSPIRL